MRGTTEFLIFRVVATLLLFTIQWYLHKRSLSLIKGNGKFPLWSSRFVSFLFLLFNAPLAVLLFYPSILTEISKSLLYEVVLPFYVWHGATFFIFLALGILRILQLPFDAISQLAKLIHPFQRRINAMKSTPGYEHFDKSRRVFMKTGAAAFSAYSFLGAAKGVIDRDEYDIIEKTVHIANLPDEFKGFTVGLMSDVHSSVFMTKPEMDDYVAALNNLKTDIIFVPGDFVNSQTEEVYPFAEAFSALRAPYGVYGCLGNHDYFANVDVVAKEVDACGVKLLRNDAVKIQKGNSFINVIGVDDIPMSVKPESYLARALSSVKNSSPKLLLCHKPYFLETIAGQNIDLTLAGHTHGGQIVFAKIGNTYISPATLFSKYVSGLYKFNNAQMYVTRGIGTVGVPFRVNCPPEITKITLQ